ncbi:hypothetical protein LEN26_006153 [Aphanomyces euteiches]|nr:hypothetical protein LEN26_006153 [Aphanomyces euteiches]
MTDVVKKTVLATNGSRLLATIEPVDRYAAEGRRHVLKLRPIVPNGAFCRVQSTTDERGASLEEAKRLVDEERRRTTTNKLEKFVLDAKTVFRSGGFGLSQNESCIQRLTNLGRVKVTDVDLSNMHLNEMLVDSLADYLASPSCIVVSLNVANTKLVPRQVKQLALACGAKMQFFQASKVRLAIPMLRSRQVVLPRTGCDHLDATAIGAFVAAKKKPQLEVLDLSSNDITGPPERCNLFGGIETLAEAMPKCTKLSRLILNRVNLRSDGLVLLSVGLETSTSLRVVELGGNLIQTNVSNQVSYSGMDALCEALRATHSIRHLALPQNDLDYTCAAKLAEILRVNDSIESLDVSENPLGTPSMSCFAKALQANVPLQELNLRDTGITGKGCIPLAEGLMRNSTLTALDLTKNDDMMLHDVGLTHLIAAMEENAKLIALKLPETIAPTKQLTDRLEQLTQANVALTSVKRSLASFDFAALSPLSQVNFIHKLNAWSETELRVLATNRSFVDCKLSDGQLSALEYFASLDMYAPLKRLIWAYDAAQRQETSASCSRRRHDEDVLWNDEPLIRLPPKS